MVMIKYKRSNSSVTLSIFLDDMILYRVSSLCLSMQLIYMCRASYSLQNQINSNDSTVLETVMPRPPMAKPLIFVLYMNVGIMWVQRSLTCKLLQILSILRILLTFQTTK